MYEMERFNWQKLLINNVPHKGGSRYAAVTPPPDYSPQWNAAQSIIVNSANTLSSYADRYRQIPSLPDPASQLTIAEQLNTGIDARVREIDDVVAKVNSIPDSAFNTEQLATLGLSKAGAIGLITQNRSALQNLKVTITVPNPPPPPPPPPPVVYTPGLPDYDGVGQGTRYVNFVVSPAYAANGVIYPADSDVPRGVPYYAKAQRGVSYIKYSPPAPPYIPPPYVPTYYEVLSQEVDKQATRLRQLNRVWGKPVEPAQPDYIWPTNSWQYEFWNKGYSVKEISYAENKASQKDLLTKSNGDFALYKKEVENLIQDAILGGEIPSAIVEEIITQSGIQDPVDTQVIDPAFRCTLPPTPSIPKPVLPPPVCDLPIPLPPNSNPKRMPRRRGFIPTTKPPVLELPSVCQFPPIASNSSTIWESTLMGTGATVDELDTVRRLMIGAPKGLGTFPTADGGAARALEFLSDLRAKNGTTVTQQVMPLVPPGGRDPITGKVTGLPPDSVINPTAPVTKQQQAEANRALARQRALNRAAGAIKSAPVAVAANTLAKRQTSLVRRGAVNGRNLRTQ